MNQKWINFAGNPEDASKTAGLVASVMHNGEGKIGGMFISACIASAFVEKNIKDVIETARSLIPSDSHYASMIDNILHIYQRGCS